MNGLIVATVLYCDCIFPVNAYAHKCHLWDKCSWQAWADTWDETSCKELDLEYGYLLPPFYTEFILQPEASQLE